MEVAQAQHDQAIDAILQQRKTRLVQLKVEARAAAAATKPAAADAPEPDAKPALEPAPHKADAAPAPVWMTAPEGGVEFVNAAFAQLANVQRDDLLGHAWIGLIHPDDVAEILVRREAARKGPDPYTFEARFRRQPEGWRWMLVNAKPRIDASGAFLGYVGMAMDLTEIKTAQVHQQLLINELNHRVKNTLATIQSITKQSLRNAGVDTAVRDALEGRLMAIAATHNVLTDQNWSAASLRQIVIKYNSRRRPEVV